MADGKMSWVERFLVGIGYVVIVWFLIPKPSKSCPYCHHRRGSCV